MNHEERLSKSLFAGLLNVKGMVVEDARITDSPLRSEPVLEIRVRPRRGMLRCSRCGRRRRGYDRGGGVRRWRGQDFGCWRVELVAAMPRVDCPRCGVVGRLRAVGGTGQPVHQGFRGGVRVADDGREPEDGQRFPACRVEDRRPPSPIGSRNTSRRRCPRRSTGCTRSAWTKPATARATRASPWSSTTNSTNPSRSSPATGPAGSTRASPSTARTPNAYRNGFHIVSWMSDALDKVRRRLWNQTRRGGDEKTTKRMSGVKYAVLKNPGDLTDRQSATLDAIRNTDPKGQLYRAWQLKELLRTLLKHPLEQARGELRHWVFRASRSRIPEIVELARKIRRRRPDILRTVRMGYSNARLEAFNNRIKVTIRMAYGFHHVGNLIALIMLRCGELDIRLPQPAI